MNGNGSILQSPLNSHAGAGTIQLRSPDYTNYGPTYAMKPNASGPVVQYNLDGSQRITDTAPQDAVGAFYHYFFNAHPFCLPRPRLLELFKQRRAPLLEFAVQYMGSCFMPTLPTELYEQALERTVMSGNYPKDGYSVQALLLYAIGLHANDKVPRSAQVFGLAQTLTLEIGLHRRDFAEFNGNGDRVLEECWRRTWWSMYVVNGMLTAVNPGVQFSLKNIEPLDVPLPCEDTFYVTEVGSQFFILSSFILVTISLRPIKPLPISSLSTFLHPEAHIIDPHPEHPSLPPHPPRLRRRHLRRPRTHHLLLLRLPNRRHPRPRQSLRSRPPRKNLQLQPRNGRRRRHIPLQLARQPARLQNRHRPAQRRHRRGPFPGAHGQQWRNDYAAPPALESEFWGRRECECVCAAGPEFVADAEPVDSYK